MKFNLTYDGPLPSAGNKPKIEDVWRIRQSFHPQLIDLWRSHPALKDVAENGYFPKTGGAPFAQTHHQHGGPIYEIARSQAIGLPRPEIIDLNEAIQKHGVTFRPLVRETYALHCGLRVLFLRKEPPGRVYQGGDIDGRMKTLLDALAMPQHKEQVLKDDQTPDPLYVLLEDDSMISGLSVESERLLTLADHAKDYVKLTIEVDVRVRQAKIYNHSFLGD